jgi:hypothetical protein
VQHWLDQRKEAELASRHGSTLRRQGGTVGRCEPSERADASEQSALHPAAPARARAQAARRRHASPTEALIRALITSARQSDPRQRPSRAHERDGESRWFRIQQADLVRSKWLCQPSLTSSPDLIWITKLNSVSFPSPCDSELVLLANLAAHQADHQAAAASKGFGDNRIHGSKEGHGQEGQGQTASIRQWLAPRRDPKPSRRDIEPSRRAPKPSRHHPRPSRQQSEQEGEIQPRQRLEKGEACVGSCLRGSLG